MYTCTSLVDLLNTLRYAMAKQNVTQNILAQRLQHTSHSNVNAILNGHVPISTPMLFRIADELDLEIQINLVPLDEIPGRVRKYPPLAAPWPPRSRSI